MEEHIRDPKEDISYIRSILEKTVDDMKGVAPWFTGFGVMWLIYGLLHAAQRIVLTYVPLTVIGQITQAGAVIGWLFYILLAVGFSVVRKKLARQRLNTLAVKLVDVWGVCIYVFLALTVVLNVAIPSAAVRMFSFPTDTMSQIGYSVSVCQSFLIFVMPVLPLIITALFLASRRMLWAGIVFAVLSAVILGCHIFLLWSGGLSVSTGWIAGYTVVICLLDIIPGVMLLIFGLQLKRA